MLGILYELSNTNVTLCFIYKHYEHRQMYEILLMSFLMSLHVHAYL